MSIQMFGLPVSRGVAIGRAVIVASSRVDVANYYVDPERVADEIDRIRRARDTVARELSTLKRDLPADAPHDHSFEPDQSGGSSPMTRAAQRQIVRTRRQASPRVVAPLKREFSPEIRRRST